MTTTMVRDSIVGDAWIQATAAQVPVQRVIGKDGQPTGDIVTGPVRLGYFEAFTLPKKKNETDGEPKFGGKLLFTPLTDWNIFYEEYYKLCAQIYPEYYDVGTKQYYGLHSPFNKQEEKIKNPGFTPGCVYLNSTSKYKPGVVDSAHNPIVDPSRVYSGVWAICSVKPYAYGDRKDPKQKIGIAFGIQTVMIIGDDSRLSKVAQAPDSREQFKGINVSAPVIRPDMAASMPTGHAPAAPIPGYTAHGGGAARPTGAPPVVPQERWVPPAGAVTPPPIAPAYAAPPPLPGATEDDASIWL